MNSYLDVGAAHQQSAAYGYSVLPSKTSIRLLQIIPDESCSHGFSLRLKAYQLESAPPFWALSYTWGPSDFQEGSDEITKHETRYVHINCDGREIQVGETLFDFLKQVKNDMAVLPGSSKPQAHSHTASNLHRLLVPDKSLSLWIDAVCIDQHSSQERCQQVQLMGQIYEAARKVVVWLGQTEPNDNVCWTVKYFIPMIMNMGLSKKGSIELFNKAGPELDHPEVSKMLGKEICDRWRSSYPEFFAFFLKKRWLTRGWVVQEAAIPQPEDIVLQCGRVQFSWSVINTFAAFILRVRWDEALNDQLSLRLPDWKKRPGTIDRLWNPVQNSLPEFSKDKVGERLAEWQKLRWGATTDEDIRHAEVLHTFHRLRMYKFENPLDHIYGALGLIHRILGRNYKLGVVPNYNIPVEHAYTQVTTWLLQHLHNLDILGLTGLAEGRYENLPSWVPDFSFLGPSHYTSLQRLRQLSKGCRLFRAFDTGRTAYRSYRHGARSEDSATLIIEGALIDKVKETRSLKLSRHHIITNVSWLLNFCNRQGSYGLRGDPLAEVAVATLSADLKPMQYHKDHCRQWVQQCIAYNTMINRPEEDTDSEALACLKAISSQPRYAGNSEPFMTLKEANEAVSRDDFISQLMENPISKIVQYVTPGRQVLETEKGGLGLGPAAAMAGDEIWVVRGSRMPLLLRKTQPNELEVGDSTKLAKETYVLVGEIYLHGIMYGEIMTEEFTAKLRPVALV